ncbi:MAG: hypothetical protein ABI791_01455 [Acidobacteriota bacterium]
MAENEELSNTSTSDGNTEIISDPVWYASGALVTLVAIFLRFYDLGLKPFHHDEGVNGFFLTNLFRDGLYKYDPANYHGPTLYYIALAFAKVFGLETVTVRASVAVFGVLTVILTLFLWRYLGKIGSLSAALFLALSPGMVFISRYFIHETLFVFLSLAIAASIVFFLEKRRAGIVAIGSLVLILLVCFLPSTLTLANYLSEKIAVSVWVFRGAFFLVEVGLVIAVVRMVMTWNNGRPIYLILASACASLYFATKETAFITLGTMAIACVCVWIWRRMYKPSTDADRSDEIDDSFLNWANFRRALGERTDLLLITAAAAAVFIYLGVLFFSSFFTYPEGVKAAFEAYALWTKTGSKDHTQNGMWAYFEWGYQSELPIFVLSAVGTVIAFVKARHRFAMFAGLWALGLLAAYTIIPYKTPWLALSFLLPMCLVAGYGINELVRAKNASLRTLGVILTLAASVWMTYQTYDTNFVRYADEDMPYVYAHTKREFLDLMAEIDRYADKSGKGKDAKIEIVSPDYWPMVWYLRDYKQANFHGQLVDTNDAEMIIAKKGDQDAEVIRRYSARYEYVASYALRPGVDLVLLVRKDLADDGKELYRIGELK